MNFSQKTVLALLLTVSSSSQLFCPPVKSGPSLDQTLLQLIAAKNEIDVLKENAKGIKTLAQEFRDTIKQGQPVSDEKLKEADAYLLAASSSIVKVAGPIAQIIAALTATIPSAFVPGKLKDQITNIKDFSEQLAVIQELVDRLEQVRKQ